jgi:hypothetical protein
MVRHTLVAKPDVSNRELFARAVEIAPAAVDGLSLRQFHARFRLPIVRHEMARRPRPRKDPAVNATRKPASQGEPAQKRPKQRRPRRTRQQMAAAANHVAQTEAMRPEVRAALVEFAVQLEGAEQRIDLVRVVAGIDTFVDRILQLAKLHFTGADRPAPAAPPAQAPEPVPESQSGSDSKAA